MMGVGGGGGGGGCECETVRYQKCTGKWTMYMKNYESLDELSSVKSLA
jgi:hypothetical protein